jgi:predicted DCC family thiol-disulfide oxidoreductase YuxK
MRFDTQKRFIYCAQNDPVAHEVLLAHGHQPPKELSSSGEDGSVLLLAADGELIDKAHAPLYALKFLGFPWNILASVALLIPRSISDVLYDAVAKRRYALFGKKSTCRIPTKEEKECFLHRIDSNKK